MEDISVSPMYKTMGEKHQKTPDDARVLKNYAKSKQTEHCPNSTGWWRGCTIDEPRPKKRVRIYLLLKVSMP